MTDKEKIKHHDTIKEIKKRMPACFGAADVIFAGHAMDEKRAKELRKLAADNKISLAEVEDIALVFLHRKGSIPGHLKKQMIRVTKLFSKKLK